MGKARQPDPVAPFCGVLRSPHVPWCAVRERLEILFGQVLLESPDYPFTSTRYYDREMGEGILRRFLSFAGRVPPERLASAKLATNGLEADMAEAFGSCAAARPVNIDPGHVEPAKVVLASTKNFYHRVYLGDGIWAEVTMHFQDRAWHPFPWTFPDFRSGAYDEFFTRLRSSLRKRA